MVEFYDTDLRKFKKKVDEASNVKKDGSEIVRGKLVVTALRKLMELEEIYGYIKSSVDFNMDDFDLFRQIVDMETSLDNFVGDNLKLDLYDPKYAMDTHPMACHYGSGISFYDDLSDIKAHKDWQTFQKRAQIYTVKINDLMGGGSD